MARINVTIPDALYERLEAQRDRLNASRVCTEALEKEIDMIEDLMTPEPEEDLLDDYSSNSTAANNPAASLWNDHDIHDKISDILRNVCQERHKAHHFGCPYLTSYQIAILFEQAFPAGLLP